MNHRGYCEFIRSSVFSFECSSYLIDQPKLDVRDKISIKVVFKLRRNLTYKKAAQQEGENFPQYYGKS